MTRRQADYIGKHYYVLIVDRMKGPDGHPGKLGRPLGSQAPGYSLM